MFNLDPAKLIVIAVVAIILLGPDKLPQFARQVGGAWRSFNEFRHRMESEVRSTMPDLPPTSEIARLARSPSALLNHLSTMSSDDKENDTENKEDGEAPDGSFQPPLPAEGDRAVATNGTAPHGPAPHDAPPSGIPSEAAHLPASPPAPGPQPAPEGIAPGDPTLN